MPEYRDENVTYVRRGGAGRVVAILFAIAALIAVVLFATGFWSAKVTKEGALPEVDVSAKGGALPQVDMDSKRIEVGTTKTTVEVPKVETKKETIDVPVVGVSDGKTDKK